MKTATFLKILAVVAMCNCASLHLRGQSIESMPPVVVKTIPESGKKDVPAGEMEIKITFSKEMSDGSWSFVGPMAGSAFTTVVDPKYSADHKTCVWKVKLEPGKTYAYWLNNQRFGNFKDAQGHPAVPYLLVFATEAAK